MNNKKVSHTQFIPSCTSPEGRTLTSDNWHKTGVEWLHVSLMSWLMKPGIDVLKSLNGLPSFMGWSGNVLLDARLPLAKSRIAYTFQSEYDGSHLRFDENDIAVVISAIQPSMVLLPRGLEDGDFDIKRIPSINRDNIYFPLTDEGHGLDERRGYQVCDDVDFQLSGHASESRNLDDLIKETSCQTVQIGDFSSIDYVAFAKQGTPYIVSDRPAMDGLNGVVYSSNGPIILTENSHELNFERIDKDCNCSTCNQGFTCAYLYHLYMNTPLLCQRLLIQHNIYHTQAEIKRLFA
jgi:queuine tRNA-ribosyltransferase